jgi:hypothetical protein
VPLNRACIKRARSVFILYKHLMIDGEKYPTVYFLPNK